MNQFLPRTIPHASDLEAAVLGAMLLEQEGTQLGLELIQNPEVFYQRSHQLVFEAILATHQAGHKIDVITVTEQARKLGTLDQIGKENSFGPHYIVQLTSHVNSAAHLEYHIRLLQEHYVRRQVIYTQEQLLRKAYDDTEDPLELLATSQANLLQLSDMLCVKKEEHVNQVMYRNMKEIAAKFQGQASTGIPSCCDVITKLTGGWQESDLIVLAARPSMGKTAYALAEAKHIAMIHQIPVAIFSLEMSSEQLANRLLAAETRVNLNHIRRPALLTDEKLVQLQQGVHRFARAPLYIDDTAGLTIQQFRAKAIKMKAKYGIKLIVVDYLQLMQDVTRKSHREQEIAAISRQLKLVAKELKLPIIAISQMSREVEKRESKRPQLSDLRESGSIEQDADVIVFLYRREYYAKDRTDPEWKNKMEIVFAKHRNGELDDLIIEYDLPTMRFGDVGSLFNDTELETNDSYSQNIEDIYYS
ncbi:replicative DNA helicase [Adhaeribacter radiodurans]|uniref:Replicative DNA helicase n=1 Tax=Adhaeribacter radiodurans TaxID=2745197 RepID=A0A7L7LDM0_9BACT|nr:replicative DNA helicase [Adhaeribacter radiodurans]QMU30499.1 replicative DNA helicase [Adhaeribacter radiodurans]